MSGLKKRTFKLAVASVGLVLVFGDAALFLLRVAPGALSGRYMINNVDLEKLIEEELDLMGLDEPTDDLLG